MKMNKLVYAFVAFIIVASFAFTNPGAKATKFKVATAESKLGWLAKKVTGQHNGFVTISKGDLDVEKSVLKGGSFEIDMKTIVVEDIKDAGYNAKLKEHLDGEDFFNVAKFPTASFVITEASPIANAAAGTANYNVKGKLTIKGITNDISFPAVVTATDNDVKATAKIVVDRSKFDVRYASKSFFEDLGDKTIYDDFELDLNLVAKK